MGKTAAKDPAVAGVFKKPFAEQAAFFRGKLGRLMPTARWTDVQKSQHDRGFMVAGAARADLLADLAAAVDRAIVEGKSLEAFRKDFDAIVERRGWSYRGQRNWRTRVIYTTNMATSYAAGRLAQLRAGGFAYWMYKHSDSVLYPRPLHVSWDGLTRPAEDTWFLTHYPPNGWGCKCRVIGLRSREAARRMGGEVKPAPDDGIDAKTGAPAGIDRGWDYMPGNTVADTVAAMAEKTLQWEYSLAKAYMQNVPDTVRDDLATSYRSLPSVADDVRRYAQRVMEERTHLDIPPYRTLGLLTAADVKKVRELTGVDADGFDFAVDPHAVRHVRDEHGSGKTEAKRGQRAVTARDFGRLPEVLNSYDRSVSAGASRMAGRPQVSFSKRIGNETVTAVMEARTGRKMMALQTMYVKSASP